MTFTEIISSLRQVFLALHEMQTAEAEGTFLTPQMKPEMGPER